jgi:PTS system nitrogen regulatory IIA component
MKLVDLIQVTGINADLSATDKPAALTELSGLLAQLAPGIGAGRINEVLSARERLATTGVGDGVAIPHGKLDRLGQICAAVGLSRGGIDFEAVDGQPVHVLVALLAPEQATSDHLKALARVARLLKDPQLRDRLLECASAEEVYQVIADEDGKH